jgi:hypothetical protein
MIICKFLFEAKIEKMLENVYSKWKVTYALEIACMLFRIYKIFKKIGMHRRKFKSKIIKQCIFYIFP